MFELDSVTKKYGRTAAVDSLNLTVAERATTVLIGPSGCGKSTLLRLMIGLIQPTSGSIKFGSEYITPDNILLLRRRMGYVIQEGGLFPHLTAKGNVALLARYLGWSGSKITERIRELCELTQLPEEMLSRYPQQLSGGQRQRVSLMRALMLDPDVLLLDEPLGALDPMIRRDLQGDLRRIFEQLGKTVVLVTHDLGEAAYFGEPGDSSIVLIRDGRIIQKGKLQELVDEPSDSFVTEFINAQRSPLDSVEVPK